jgi:hypothetical protein
MAIHLVQIELAAGLSEVVQRGRVGGQGLRLLGEFRDLALLGQTGQIKRKASSPPAILSGCNRFSHQQLISEFGGQLQTGT